MLDMMKFLKKMKEDRNIFKDVFCERMKDMTIPLTDRWKEFCYAVNNELYSNDRGYIWRSVVAKTELGRELYDDYEDRRSYHSFPDIIEYLEEEMECDDDSEYTVEFLDRLKEEMLQSGYSGFTYDW